MSQQEINDKIMIKYLLGNLSKEEQIQLQEKFFTDRECFEQLLAVEEELIDDYVRKKLSREDSKRFEMFYLVTLQRRGKVEFAHDLHKTLSAPKWQVWLDLLRTKWQDFTDFLTTPSPVLQWTFAIGAIVFFVGGSWLMMETLRLRTEVKHMKDSQANLLQRAQELQEQVNYERSRSELLAEQLEREKDQRIQAEQKLAILPSSQSTMVSFLLVSDLLRGSENVKRLIIPQSIRVVQLQLDLTNNIEYKSYRAVLETVEGDEVWSQDILRPYATSFAKAVIVSVPAPVLAEDDYIMRLSGINAVGAIEEVDDYSFRIVKR